MSKSQKIRRTHDISDLVGLQIQLGEIDSLRVDGVFLHPDDKQIIPEGKHNSHIFGLILF